MGVNLTTATTTTVLPCSSYLSAQSTYLGYLNDPLDPGYSEELWDNGYHSNTDLGNWIVKFGQSPECKSYAEAMSKGQYTISQCGSRNTVLQSAVSSDNFYPSQIPPSVDRYSYPDALGWITCCGNCSLDIPEVRLYYFPDESAVCDNRTTNNTLALPARNLEKRIHSLVANGSTAIVSGHTLYVNYSHF